MSLRGTLRALEREAKRRQREAERQHKQHEKMLMDQAVAAKVKEYNDYIKLISSIHKECGKDVNWDRLKNANPPSEPIRSNYHEKSARAKQEAYTPSFLDKVSRKVEAKKKQLVDAIEIAKDLDAKKHKEERREYNAKFKAWESMQKLAERILSGDLSAYDEAIQHSDSLKKVANYDLTIHFNPLSPSLIDVEIEVDNDQIIPTEAYTQLKSGKLSIKHMPKTKRLALYQDYVSGCVLRVARELFALLPIEMAIVTAVGKLLNTSTGQMEDQPIISVVIPRDTIPQINFELVDPSDAMSNFVHHMKFLKTKGFQQVEKLKSSDLES